MAEIIIAPIPTAPIGAASPICPTTAVSTAPKIGMVAFAKTIGIATLRTLLWESVVELRFTKEEK